MPPRASIVKVLTPPNDDAIVQVVDSNGDAELEDVSFDAFKAVPVSERRASQQQQQQQQIQAAQMNGAVNPLAFSPQMRGSVGPMGMANYGPVAPPRGAVNSGQPFLMQVPQPMNNQFVQPGYMPQGQPMQPRQNPYQQQQQQQMRPMANGNVTRLPELVPPRQSNGTAASPKATQVPRAAPPMTRPQPTSQQQPVSIPSNNAVFLPDTVEDPNARFKLAKKESAHRKREQRKENRNNSAPSLRSTAAAADSANALSKRNSDPLPEISRIDDFDDADFGTIPLSKTTSTARKTNSRASASPPPEVSGEIMNAIVVPKSSQPLVKQNSSGLVGESSLMDFNDSDIESDMLAVKPAQRNKPAARGTRQRSGSNSDSDDGLRSPTGNYSFGSFGFGSGADMSGLAGRTSAPTTRGSAMDVRPKPRGPQRRGSITSPVATVDDLVHVTPKDSFSERYFGFDPSTSFGSRKLSNVAGASSRAPGTSANGTSGAARETASTSGPTGEGIYGTPLAESTNDIRFTDKKGSPRQHGGSGGDWGASGFGSALFGSFGGNTGGIGNRSMNLYPTDSAGTYDRHGSKNGLDDGDYYGAGLDSFMLKH